MNKKIVNQIIGTVIVLVLTLANILILANVVYGDYKEIDRQDNSTSIREVNIGITTKEGSHESTEKISEKASIYVNIDVDKTGYVENARLIFNNPNFKISDSLSANEDIQKIENGEIYLNRITNSKQIEIPIEFVKSDILNLNDLGRETYVSVSGNYINSNGKTKDWNTTKIIKINWYDDAEAYINQNIEKYIEYDGKTIVETTVKTGIKENKLPISKTEITLNAIKIDDKMPDQVKVIEASTKATDGKASGNEMDIGNMTYNKESGIVTIKKENIADENNNVRWDKNCYDEYKVIYIYNEEMGKEGINAELQSYVNINTYNNTTISSNEQIQGEIARGENISSINTWATNEVSKGYMYANSGYETEYISNIKTEITYTNDSNIVNIISLGDKLKGEDLDVKLNQNMYYSKTIFNQNNMKNIIGENGYIEVLANGQSVYTLNKDTEANEDGNIEINYEGNQVNNVELRVKAEKVGILETTNIKRIIGQTSYSEEVINRAQAINLGYKVTANIGNEEKEADILLKETTTKMELDIDRTTLTAGESQDIEMYATFKTDDVKYDLYRNPVVQIIMPIDVQDIQVNSLNMAFDGEIKIRDAKVDTNENGNKVINIYLEGDQRTYTQNNAQINIKANVTLNKYMANKKEAIVMNYSNEKAKGYEENATKSKDIEINSKYGLIMYNKLNNQESQTEGTNNELKEIQTSVNDEEKTARIETTLINNYDTDMQSVEIYGTLPKQGNKVNVDGNEIETTVNANLVTGVTSNIEGSVTYYKGDNSDWNEELKEDSKEYKVIIPNQNLQRGQVVSVGYDIKVPANLDYNQKMYSAIQAKGTVNGEEVVENGILGLRTEEQQQIENNTGGQDLKEAEAQEIAGGLEVTTKAISGGKELQDQEEVYEGQTITYEFKLKNTGNTDLTNVEVVSKHTNSLYYEIVNTQITEIQSNSEYQELEKEYNSVKIDKIEAGKEEIVRYQIVIKEVEENQTTIGEISIKADNIEETKINTIENKIKQAKIKLNIKKGYSEDRKVVEDIKVPIVLSITNLTDDVIENATLRCDLSNRLNIDSSTLPCLEDIGNGYEFVSFENNILTLKLHKLDSKNTEMIVLYTDVRKDQEDEFFKSSYEVETNDERYVSNEIKYKIEPRYTNMTAKLTSDKEGKELEDGDEIIYKLELENVGNIDANVAITDQVSKSLKIQEAYLDNDSKEELTIEEIANVVLGKKSIAAGEKVKLYIKAKVDLEREKSEEISNYVEINGYELDGILKSDVLTNKIKVENDNNEDNNDDNIEDNPNDNPGDNPGDNQNNNTENSDGRISGSAWLDSNVNASKDNNETRIEGIKMQLVDLNGSVKAETSTNSNGEYSFNDISNGEYRVIAQYDSTKYKLTDYKKVGVSEKSNSDFTNGKIGDVVAGVTDQININNNIAEDIDIGLVESKKFDLRIDKTITKIAVKTKSGTKTYNFDNKKLAKVEIHSKEVEGATVLIEYQIAVTNEGEIEGYANKITDYVPTGLKFASESNKDWYQENDGTISTDSFSKSTIKPGETKSTKLVLTKSMTEENTGIVLNTAEITKSSNSEGISDIDSVAGNKQENEDDMSSAQAIIGIKTGIVQICIGSIFIILIIIGINLYIAKRRFN